VRVEVDIWSVNSYPQISQTFNTFGKHLLKLIGPDVGLNVKEHIGIKARNGGIPLVRKISIIANMVPMWVKSPKTVIGIDYLNSTMWPKHGFQPYSMLLSAWPVKNERLNFHG